MNAQEVHRMTFIGKLPQGRNGNLLVLCMRQISLTEELDNLHLSGNLYAPESIKRGIVVIDGKRYIAVLF